MINLYLVLTLFIPPISTAISPTISNLYNGTDSISAAGVSGTRLIFGTNKAIYMINGSSTEAKKIGTFANVKDISCYEDVCISANEYSGYVWRVTDSSMSLEGRYPLELQGISKVKNMRVSIIPSTNYFLLAAEREYGLTRFLIGNTESHSRLDINDIKSSSQIATLLAFPFTTYSFASYQGQSKFHVFDYTSMLHLFDVSTDSQVNNLVAYTYDLSSFMLGYSTMTTYVLYNFMSQVKYKDYKLGTATDSPSIVSAFVLPQTEYTLLVLKTGVQIINHFLSDAEPLIYSKTITDATFFIGSQKSGLFYLFFNTSIQLLDPPSTFEWYCHPNCRGCSKPLSPYFCSDCNTNSQQISATTCLIPTNFSLDIISDDNELTTKFGDEWIYLCIAVGIMIVVFIIVACIYQGAIQSITEQDHNSALENALLMNPKDDEIENLKKKEPATTDIKPAENSKPAENPKPTPATTDDKPKDPNPPKPEENKDHNLTQVNDQKPNPPKESQPDPPKQAA